MIGVVLIHTIASLRQGRIVVLGSIRHNLNALVKEKENTKSTGPRVQSFLRACIGTVKVQSQLGSNTVVPNSIVILGQLKQQREWIELASKRRPTGTYRYLPVLD